MAPRVANVDLMWSIARSLSRRPCGGVGFTVDDLVDNCLVEINRGAAEHALGRWLKLGAIKRTEVCHGANRFLVTKFTKVRPDKKAPSKRRPPAGVAQNQIWRAMKMLKRFTLDDLVSSAQSEACTPTLRTVQYYVQALAKHNFVTRLCSTTKGRRMRYMITDAVLGPNAPRVDRQGNVHVDHDFVRQVA